MFVLLYQLVIEKIASLLVTQCAWLSCYSTTQLWLPAHYPLVRTRRALQ